jgi:hypothetical protein
MKEQGQGDDADEQWQQGGYPVLHGEHFAGEPSKECNEYMKRVRCWLVGWLVGWLVRTFLSV